MRELMAHFDRSRDLVQIGAYQQGSDPALDEAIDRLPAIEAFLRQTPDEYDALDATVAKLRTIVGGVADGEAVA
jgi:flagellar biosynthesis/type III secretory pathway ATPase